MCGWYRRTTREEELARIYSIPIPSQPDLPISFNEGPSQEVLAIRVDPETTKRGLRLLGRRCRAAVLSFFMMMTFLG
jgi:hypothetical protein